MNLAPPGKQKKKGGKRRRGSPRATIRRVRMSTDEEMAWGTPTRLSKAQDLSDGEILEAMIADVEDAGWVGRSAERADYVGGAAIPMALVRDIHLFVRRALRSRSPLFHYQSRRAGKNLETPLGAEFMKIERALRSDIPSHISQYSEYVKYFLYGYKMFGLDGSDVSKRAIGDWVGADYSHDSIRNGLVDWLRDEYKYKRKKPAIYFDEKRGHHVFPTEQPKFSDISFREVLRRRRHVPAKNDRKSAKLIERIFQRHESIRVVRLDIGVLPGYVHKDNPVGWIKWAMKRFLNYASKRIGPFAGLVGRIAKFQYSRSRGYYCHIMFFYEDSPRVQVKGLEDRIGVLWSDKVMRGVGAYAPMSKSASKFRREPKSVVGRFDREARTRLLQSIRYLCVFDEYFRLDLPLGERKFLASDLPLERALQKGPMKRGNDSIAELAVKPLEPDAPPASAPDYSNYESPLQKALDERLGRMVWRSKVPDEPAGDAAASSGAEGAECDPSQVQGEEGVPAEPVVADLSQPAASDPGASDHSGVEKERSRFRGYKLRDAKSKGADSAGRSGNPRGRK